MIKKLLQFSLGNKFAIFDGSFNYIRWRLFKRQIKT